MVNFVENVYRACLNDGRLLVGGAAPAPSPDGRCSPGQVPTQTCRRHSSRRKVRRQGQHNHTSRHISQAQVAIHKPLDMAKKKNKQARSLPSAYC